MEKYGRVTIKSVIGTRHRHCVCDCGTEFRADIYKLRTGHTASCGCLRRELVAAKNTSHGMSGTTEHRIWKLMVQRCTNRAFHKYKDYGGRGIRVCERWRSFENFYADMGPRPQDTTLDRINNNGNYEPGNCRWATDDQQRNNKRSSKKYMLAGRERTVTELAGVRGCAYETMRERLLRLPVHQAVYGK